MGTPTRASNIVQFTPREEPLAFAPGVPPFDRTNPVHVRAWNTMVALGWSEQRAQERGL
jgi:hypothetical protein